MTAQSLSSLTTTPSGHPALVSPGTRHHPAPECSSSVIGLHVQGAGCDCPDCRRAEAQALALVRLAAYVDAEGDSLDRVLRLLDLRGGRADLAALRDLHMEPGQDGEALRGAASRLEHLLEDLAEIPRDASVPGLVPAADRSVVRHLDANVRWLGARTQDALATVRRALG